MQETAVYVDTTKLALSELIKNAAIFSGHKNLKVKANVNHDGVFYTGV